MLDAALFSLSQHAKAPVELLAAGNPGLEKYIHGLPPSWQAALGSTITPDEAIHQIWSPLIERARGWITRLATITDGFVLAVSTENTYAPKLFYVVAGLGSISHGWQAGSPVSETALEEFEARSGISIPSSYRQLLGIHNGFLENGDPEVGFAPLDGLACLHRQPNLMPFFNAGMGYRQCYDFLAPAGRHDFITQTWDHETQQTRRPQSFWSFLKELTVYGFG